jgi:hypothetical protein
MSTRNVTENLIAHLAIQDLLNRYTNALNQRDWAALQSVFTEDGVWDCGGPQMGDQAFLFSGAAGCANGIAGLLAHTECCVQSNHAIVIEVAGRDAKATSTMNEYVIPNGAATATSIWGTYYDEIQLESDGEWRFRKRTFRFTTVDPSMSKGPVLARFPCDQTAQAVPPSMRSDAPVV